jgi:hypothetical protein
LALIVFVQEDTHVLLRQGNHELWRRTLGHSDNRTRILTVS